MQNWVSFEENINITATDWDETRGQELKNFFSFG